MVETMRSGTEEPRTLSAAIARAARRFPDKGIALVDNRGRETGRRTYPELAQAAAASAGRWAALGVRPGDRVLVALGTSWSFLDAWLGAASLGALPVAVPPTGSVGGAALHLRKVDAVADRLGATHIVATEAFRDNARELGFESIGERCIASSELEGLAPASFTPPAPETGETAFLQLTSGSTGVPRAVEISHRALLHNALASDDAIGAPFGAPASSHTDNIVSWLPLNHDMGLVGCLFYAINCGFDLWLLTPKSFLARPHLWLEHIGAHGSSLSPAPNFAYQLCVERIAAERAAKLDLTPWRAAMTGAEMVRTDTGNSFCDRFAAAGFKPEVLRPCYGLAEGTLAVTFDRRGGLRAMEAPEDLRAGWGLTEVVSVGSAIADTEVSIVGPDEQALPDGQVGEIRARGPSIFSGYYNDPEATAAGLRNGWLCTGDLGFVQEGELFVTGRLKDLLIVRGQNMMPQEFESVAEATSGGGGSRRAAAFTVARGPEGEEIVVALEVEDPGSAEVAALEREVRLRIGETLGVPLSDLVLVRRGRLPRTTSGKVQRNRVRADYLAGTLTE